MDYTPAYIELYKRGDLQRGADSLYAILGRCSLCPRNCGADRTSGEKGRCKSGILPVVSAYHPHFGEESCLVGRHGSGTIFFTHCNLSCVFCQNYDISHLGRGEEVSFKELAGMMLSLQSRGCHNINFVTPTHMVYAIVQALRIAIPEGLCVPLVYNSGGYDSTDTVRLLEGIIDIYMPDFKYMDARTADTLCNAPNYPEIAVSAITEMHRQVGDLMLDSGGIARKGLLIRHLVLPDNYAATDKVLAQIAQISTHSYVNIMDQYRPEYRAKQFDHMRRRITVQEFDDAVDIASACGITRLDRYR